jgi:hypothetical protein
VIAVGYKSSLQDVGSSVEERSIRLRSPNGPDQMLYGCKGTSPECSAKSYTNPAFAPDGSRVVFDAGAGLALINIDGSGFHQLPAHSDDDGQPAFSPAGDRIAFVVHRDGSRTWSVWTCDATDGRNARLVVRDGSHPVLSTRNWIAFVRGDAIYRVRPNGSGLRRLTSNGSRPPGRPTAGVLRSRVQVRTIVLEPLRTPAGCSSWLPTVPTLTGSRSRALNGP